MAGSREASISLGYFCSPQVEACLQVEPKLRGRAGEVALEPQCRLRCERARCIVAFRIQDARDPIRWDVRTLYPSGQQHDQRQLLLQLVQE